MRKQAIWGLALTALAAVALAQTLAAQEATRTIISIKDLDCPSCAKRVVKSVNAVAGVALAKADVKASALEVTPQAQKAPSPRALWEAVEKAGFKPTKLVGPGGTFTAKPAS